MVEVDLLDFMGNCKRLAKQALGKAAGESAGGGLARWKHVVIHCYRLEDDHSYRETENRLQCFSELRGILELDLGDVPDYSTIYRACLRIAHHQSPDISRKHRCTIRQTDSAATTKENHAQLSSDRVRHFVAVRPSAGPPQFQQVVRR